MPEEAVALNVPFSEYGGDSLLGVEVLARAARVHAVADWRSGGEGAGGGGLGFGAVAGLLANLEMLSIQDMVNKAGEQGQREDGEAKRGAGVRTVILERSRLAPPTASPAAVGGISACAHGDIEAAVALCARGWAPQDAVDKHGNTALMWAAGAGHLSVVRWLVEEQRVEVDQANKQGRTALMWAAKNGQCDVVDWLFTRAGADAAAQMKDGSRAWDWAIFGGHLPTLQLLAACPRVDVHALNYFGCGAAFWAAASGNVATCQWLYDLGIDFTLVNDAGHTAVHKAAWKGHEDCLKWMLLHDRGPSLGYQLHMLAADGRSPQDKARVNGHIAVANWLQTLEARFPVAVNRTPSPGGKAPCDAMPAASPAPLLHPLAAPTA
jgi:ankyrin repeat protein